MNSKICSNGLQSSASQALKAKGKQPMKKRHENIIMNRIIYAWRSIEQWPGDLMKSCRTIQWSFYLERTIRWLPSTVWWGSWFSVLLAALVSQLSPALWSFIWTPDWAQFLPTHLYLRCTTIHGGLTKIINISKAMHPDFQAYTFLMVHKPSSRALPFHQLLGQVCNVEIIHCLNGTLHIFM